MDDFGLYLVMTNPKVGYVKCAEAAVKAGVKILQLRMKHVSDAEYLKMAKEVRAVTRGSDTLFIVDDMAEIAARSEADGVHVGQTDMKVAEVRARFPEIRLVGLSTHSPRQALDSIPQKPDYIGVGPVWATPTKDIPDPTLGIETAARMVKSVPYPAVAIGGVDPERLPDLLRAGVKNFAMVRAVCGSDDPYSAIRRLQDIAASIII